MNYYNEIEPFCRRWLRQLIRDGLIPDGYIDNRPIQEIKAEELTREGFTQCHFFAGIGGWPLALRIAGWPDDEPVWTGSCPCQPFSDSGDQVGFRDPRHLFPTWRRLIARCCPTVVFGEQVASKLGREWLARVRLEMASLGYATRGGDYCSAGVAAPNRRQRLYWVADTDCPPRSQQWRESREETRREAAKNNPAKCSGFGGVADSTGARLPQSHKPDHKSEAESCRPRCIQPQRDSAFGRMGHADNQGRKRRRLRFVGDIRQRTPWETGTVLLPCADGKTRRIKPEIFPLAARLPGDLGLIRGAGNAINPWVAAKFIQDCYS